MTDKPLALFTSFCPQLYGTERVLLSTADSLRPEFDACIFSPPGLLQAEAQRIGIEAHPFSSRSDFTALMARTLRERRRVAVFTTSIWHSFVFMTLNVWYRRRASHIHFVMGGSTERDSFSRKHYLNRFPLTFVCPTEFIRGKLAQYGVPRERVKVIPHHLADSYASNIVPRPTFTTDGVRSIVVVSRSEPIKRIDVLLDALDRAPDLLDLPIRILGAGSLLDEFRARAAKSYPNVTFVGVTRDVLKEMTSSDLFLHLCPEEPGALVVIEALASRLPILVPDTGGTASLIKNGETGFFFRANDPDSLVDAIRTLRKTSAEELNRVAGNARASFEESFSEAKVVSSFRTIIDADLER